MNLSQFRLPLTLTAPLAVAAMLNACVSDDPEEPAASTTTSSAAATTSSAATGTTATATTGGATTGAGGSTSATATTGTSTTGEGLDCATPQVIGATSVIDFEGYDGTTAADAWQFNFNGDADGVGAVYAGLWPLEDATGAYMLSFVSGADGSTWAVSAANESATDWGGGIGMWSGCMDASSFTGIQFMVKATTPAGTAGLSMGIGGSLEASAEFSITAPGEWTLVQLPFTAFSNDAGDTTDGSTIGNFVFAAHMVYAQDVASGEWLPQPGAFDLAIDNISFY